MENTQAQLEGDLEHYRALLGLVSDQRVRHVLEDMIAEVEGRLKRLGAACSDADRATSLRRRAG